MYVNISRSMRSCLLALLAPLFITACNSSDSASSGNGDLASGYDSGEVTLLVTDAPSSEFDEVNVITDSMSLVGEGSEVHLLKKRSKIKLLDLRNSFARLSRKRVPVGTYHKFRMSVVGVELIKRHWDKDGNMVEEKIIPKLEQKFFDLNLAAQMAVHRRSRHMMKLDVDAEQSVHQDQASSTGYTFRTWARCDVARLPDEPVDEPAQDPAPEPVPVLMNEKGVARNVLTDSFELCDPADLSVCEQVNMGANTVFMDSMVQVADASSITENTQLQVIGLLDVNSGAINALHVVEDSSRLNSYSGGFAGTVSNDAIDFTVTAGTSTGTYPMRPASLPGVYDSAGNVLDINALGDGVNAEVIGLLNTFPAFELRPAVVIIATP
ncbi:MAG: DUF4382 domain-containing protein [Gammaproteobacteria bacterium]